MTTDKIILLIPDGAGRILEEILNKSGLFNVALLSSLEALGSSFQPDLIILSDALTEKQTNQMGQHLLKNFPFLPVILLMEDYSEKAALSAMRQGFFDCIPTSILETELISKVKRGLTRRRTLKKYAHLEARRDTKSLQNQLDRLQSLQKISSQIASSLDLDQVLKMVVDASVDLTQAEEGSLLLLDENTGELTMRASRNFQEDFVKTFRVPVQDSMIGKVLSSGKPLFTDGNTPQKIIPSYTVQSLMYVPLKLENRVIGVLGVDNRISSKPFTKDHVTLVSALADFAAIAIQNTRLFSSTRLERNKLETILTNIEDGVIIIDVDGRVNLINHQARDLFDIHEPNISGKRLTEVIQHAELLEFLEEKNHCNPSRIEISLEDGRVFYAQLTPMDEIGLVITFQDITNLIQLDRIKSDFVSTVSHDLRSPLTAILGYVELIERVGPVNDQQKEFIHRVQISVHNITSLINDLLDLGRIEAGFDSTKELVHLSPIIHYSIDSLRKKAQEKLQTLQIVEPDELPPVLANPVRLRQMITNLVTNAIKYTPPNGEISVIAHAAGEQIILQVKDTGQGIPTIDQPYIFDKFYRAGNVSANVPGTGLGLAIVKSIIENHQGRIWVDSSLGKGSCFTVVLPLIRSKP